MLSPFRALIGAAAVVVAAASLGFLVFAGYVARAPDHADASADAIVVLTGAHFRIAEGARLLATGRGKRLLISGVHPRVTQADIARITGLSAELLECCVDIDIKALDTVGNAVETGNWAERHGFGSLILVTSNYHLPRSLAEFARVMPAVHIEPHAVVPRGFPAEAWWLHPQTARLLLSEYLKFLPAAARLATARALSFWQSNMTASEASRRETSAGVVK